MMAQLKLFTNTANLPNPETGKREPRLQLRVNGEGIPVDRYWRKRLKEGGIKLEVKPVKEEVVKKVKKDVSQEVKKEDVKDAN